MQRILDIFRGSRPDVTPAQVIAGLTVGVTIISNLLAAFGVWHPTQEQQDALTKSLEWGFGFAALLIGGDAHLRASRNKADAHVHAAAVAVQGGALPPGEQLPPVADELPPGGAPLSDPSAPETARTPDPPAS